MALPNIDDNTIEQLKTNIYRSDDFLRYNRKIRNIKDLNRHLKINNYSFYYPQYTKTNNPLKKNVGHVKQIDIILSNTQHNYSKIFIFSTAEHNALTIGKISIRRNKINFILPRFHTGIPAQIDLKIAIKQTLEFKKLMNEFYPKKNMDKKIYGVYFIREGYLTDLQTALYNKFKITVPFTLAHVEHIKKKRGKLKRSVKICDINFEGLDPKSVSTLIFCGNIASGIQQLAVADYTLKEIRKKVKKNFIKKIIIFSPLLTLTGALSISRWAIAKKINIIFVASAALLDTDDNFYYSPVANNPLTCVEQKLVDIHESAHDPASIKKACVRCNWTASFLNPHAAFKDSEKELAHYGSSNKLLLQSFDKITHKKLKEKNIRIADLTPYSTSMSA